MGRLGFNLVREKDPMKSVENGLPESDQTQPESKHSADVGELLLAIDRKTSTIRHLRILILILSALVLFLMWIVYTEEASALNKHFDGLHKENQESIGTAEEFKREYDATWKLSLSEAQNITAKALKEKEQLARDLKIKQDALQAANERYEDLASQLKIIETNRNDLIAQLAKKDEEAHKLTTERDELAGKLEEEQRKLQQRREVAAVAKTTSKPPRGLFNTERLGKFEDIVKDIETVGRMVGNIFRDVI